VKLIRENQFLGGTVSLFSRMSPSLFTPNVEYIGDLIVADEDKREYGHHRMLSAFHLPDSHDDALSTDCFENISA
jgi:hypothetical protein